MNSLTAAPPQDTIFSTNYAPNALNTLSLSTLMKITRHWLRPSITFSLVNKVYPFTRPIRAPYDNINVTNKQIYTMCKIIPYVNPLKPGITYYKAT